MAFVPFFISFLLSHFLSQEKMRSNQLQGKTAVITGGASGIGRATALLFAREGAAVTIVDLNQGAGLEVERAISLAGGRAIFERADVTSASDCRRVIERSEEHTSELQS